jgi:serine/threonine protein phosphatase PrpC
MKPIVAALTDVGRVRTNNEDAFFTSLEDGIYIVCDGMGGHNAGEVASQMTCEIVARELSSDSTQAALAKFSESGKTKDSKNIRKLMEAAITTACREVFASASKDSEKAGMGTTCTVVLLTDHGKGVLGHVGDSRLYVMRRDTVHQLSEDHTYVNELVKRGIINRSEAQDHPQGNVLSRALGVQPSVAVDTMIFDIDPGDTYMLCSDGVYNYYADHKELGAPLSAKNLTGGIEQIVKTALDRGGHDNATVVAFRFSDQAESNTAVVAADERIAILKQIPVFSHLNYNELVKVLGLTQIDKFDAGSELISEGQTGEEMYVVLSGDTEILKGGKVITTLPAGVHLGEMAMVDNAPRSATARAKNDCNVLTMKRGEFFSIVRSEPVIATKLLWSLVQVLSGRLRDTNEALQGARKELADDEHTGSFEILFDDGDI